jgi:hypothetical protein
MLPKGDYCAMAFQKMDLFAKNDGRPSRTRPTRLCQMKLQHIEESNRIERL